MHPMQDAFNAGEPPFMRHSHAAQSRGAA